MRAILFDGNDNHLVDDMEIRPPADGEVVVRIHASGLRQSDLSVTIPFPWSSGTKGPVSWKKSAQACPHLVSATTW